MKTTFFKSIILGLFVVAFISSAYAGNTVKESKENNSAVNVLIVGLDNVGSNYFPESIITEETGIPQDSIGDTYNRIITRNIIQSNKNKEFKFISSQNLKGVENLIDKVKLNGKDEDTYVDLSQIKTEDYNKLLTEAHADYILFLNKHYLKWQEQPFHTLFHFVSYSLYDKNCKEVTKGNNYFTCMNLEKADKLGKASWKSSSKIATTVIKSIEK